MPKAKQERPFKIKISETNQFEFEVFAKSAAEALAKGQERWRFAETTDQWAVADGQQTKYEVEEDFL